MDETDGLHENVFLHYSVEAQSTTSTNGFIESFNGRLRDECLNVEWFTSLSEARAQLASWRHHYNHQRPHSALDDRAPAVFASLQIKHRHLYLFERSPDIAPEHSL